MTEIKKPAEIEPSKKTEVAITKKKTATSIKPSKKTTALASAAPLNLWQAFDDTFERFRNDFEDLLFPAKWPDAFSIIPQTRVPAIDLEDYEKEYILKAEMPGFKKEDVEIEAKENSIAITGYAGWKYDKKGKLYICKERACETFYREEALPEEIKIEDVTADLTDGVLEITLPKKAPKKKRKVSIK
jgi:HSP20 family protein